MYINDVLRSVRRLYPSEYGDEEMYIWCDEVSAMLKVEDRNVFKEAFLRADKNGRILLPEGVKAENIAAAESGGKALCKGDIRTVFGKNGKNPNGGIHIVYSVPYYPIRLAKYSGTVVVSDNGKCIKTGLNELCTGDIINITAGGYTAEEKSVFETEYTESGECVLKTAPLGIPDGEYEDCKIWRTVTDETVCQPPYDSMYIDYIIAKINMYQHDMESYNHHMTAFNSKLCAYKKWLINHMPSENGKMMNWW